MPQVVGEAAIMALCCLLLVALSVVYPVAAFEAGEQGRVHTKTESGVVTSGLPEIVVNNSELQVQSLRSCKQGGHSHGRDILSDSQTQGPACTSKDISIVQNPSAPNPAGIPRFKVEILNTCVSGCPPSNIHLNCGEFASAELLNPDVFKRLATDDCLVNGGKPVPCGTMIAFTYANSLMYPLSFKSATFC